MGNLREGERVALEVGGFELIHDAPNGKWYLRDTEENTTSAPLHHSLVSCILARPSNLLDLRMACPTPNDPSVQRLEWS
jgi:hypothetical protein